MPTYTVQGPSGKTYTIEGPAGATAEQLGAYIMKESREERAAADRQRFAAEVDPTKDMGTGQRALAGVGKAMTDYARGAGQLVGLVSRDDVAETRGLDAPLMATTGGKFGEFVGKAAPLAAVGFAAPALATVKGAAALGGAAGLLEPSVSTGETIQNVVLGAGAGAAGQKLGNVIADKMAARATGKAAQFAADQSANAQRLASARAAQAKGYAIPPSDVQPQGALMEALSGLSGKIKTAQVASAKNQQVTDTLAKKAVGLTPDQQLTRDVLTNIRQQAGSAYDQFRNVGTVAADKSYMQALDSVEQTLKGATRSFPGLKSDKVADIVQTMRQPSFDAGDAIDATKVLRDLADTAYAQGDKQLGKAYKTVSGALEDALERQMQQTAPDAVKEFRQARQLIAKTYTVEKALNEGTGSVSAQALVRDLKRGKLSGDLKTIAQTAEAFPKATQALKESPKDLSPLDWATAGLGVAGTGGNPLAALGLVARPGVRQALLSGPSQKAATRQLGAPSGKALSDNALMRLLYGPSAMAGVQLE
jgi:hypothetical protein